MPLAALALLTALRLLVAATAPLAPDEAYYWTWSRDLAPGYLDHPPMVAFWVRLGTALTGDTALGVRLLGPLSAALGTVLLAGAARALFPGSGAGLRAAVLLNATLMLGAGAVTMTPDTPLLFFWTVAAWALSRIAGGGGPAWWLLAGAAVGLGFDSKYTAALLAPGIGLWLLTPALRHWLRTPWPWAAAALAAAATLPVITWNAGHGWASFAKQGGRVTAAPGWTLRYLAELLGGQVGLATPLIFVLFAAGLVAACRRWRDPVRSLPLALVLPGLLVFLEHALGQRVQANWVGVLYPGAALAAAGLGGRLWRPAAGFGAALTAALYLQASLAPLPLPHALDPTLRLAGWAELSRAAESEAARHGAAFLASEDYAAASALAWQASTLPVVAAEPRWRLFTFPAPPPGPGLLLVSTRRTEPPDPLAWRSAEPLGMLVRGRNGLEAETYRLYRVVPSPAPPPRRLPSPRTQDAAPDRR